MSADCQNINQKKSEILHFQTILRNKKTAWWGNETAAGRLRTERRLRLIIDYINSTEKDRILELGCGLGEATVYLCNTFAQITSIDLCHDLIALAKQKVKFTNVEFRVADAENLPFDSHCFDAVVGNSVLHHVSLGRVLREIKRVTKIGGKVAFCEPNLLNPHVMLERKIRFIGKLLQVSPHETAFLRWSIKKSFEDCGFYNVEVKPFDFLHPATPPSLINPVLEIGTIFEKIGVVKEFAGSLFIKAQA